ncbi:hypothetical protein ABZ422_09390 [Micromonospora zamorensis]|uniref:hypothetical protein n=1 Tax=Micromonospora zamorensis TaxID=709883 RepID=UPI0033D246F2
MSARPRPSQDWYQARARLAHATRIGNPDEIAAARAAFDCAAADREVRERLIRAAVDAAPPLTVEQIERLRDLLATPAERLPRVIENAGIRRAA